MVYFYAIYNSKLPFALLIFAIATAALAEPNAAIPVFEPGKEVRLKFDKESIECIVYVPTDYNDNYNWPVLFFYHGTGAPLSANRIKIATQGKNFVVVCMEFAPTTAETMNPTQYRAYLEREIKNIGFVRHWLQDKLKIDPKMTVLSGSSRGGWLAADIFNFRPRLAAATVIICAGYQEWLIKEDRSFAGKYVYIGAGETDENLAAAKKAKRYFVNRNADVTFEVYAGWGHRMKPDSEKLQKWFSDLRSSLNHPAAEIQSSEETKK
jgi:predicted esterase